MPPGPMSTEISKRKAVAAVSAILTIYATTINVLLLQCRRQRPQREWDMAEAKNHSKYRLPLAIIPASEFSFELYSETWCTEFLW